MSWRDRVLWREGAFLSAQHFQQQDRHFSDQLHAKTSSLRPYPWGVTELVIDKDLLVAGCFAVSSASGVLQDGTPFVIGHGGDVPLPLDIPEGTRDVVVCLALAVAQDGTHEVASEADGPGALRARYALRSFKAFDTHSDGTIAADLDVGRLRLRYVLQSSDLAGLTTVGLARIVEAQADKRVVVDDAYIPTCLSVSASTVLSNLVKELAASFGKRADELAKLLGQPSSRDVADVTDILLLQALNRWQPLLAHWASAGQVHPETLYSALVQMTGELATFTADDKRATLYPPYRHDDLQRSFGPVVAGIRYALTREIGTNRVQIRLQKGDPGYLRGTLEDRTLLSSSQFVLTVRADMPDEQLRTLVPKAVKIGASERISYLVINRVPGIAVRTLPNAPPRIPPRAGAIYLELDRSSKEWQEMKSSAGFGIHFSGDFKDLKVELWAIRQ